ncbi:rho GTPase-activating protein gacU-like [Drosophila novamexicana]|uniref:rho GTPase-activating protein gacU-like n=1 Tax=Drosophila novamexicana TaxID=47314 RepID=UPI0011E5FC45|nr:rho GTPase-activating protein gacU-like [Drosophila novamexicana]
MNLNLNRNLQQTQTKNGLSRVSLVKSQSSGKLSHSNEAPKATTTTTRTNSLRAAKLKIEAMQQQRNTGNTGNIILLRGTRNENGQIIIQNKQDILSLLSEQQQQQQQQDKATALTLNQLPTTTTVARKTIVQTTPNNNNNNNGSSNSISIVASSGKDSNTILLQTPINASQLESVLKAQVNSNSSNSNSNSNNNNSNSNNNNNNATKLIERPFMLKHASRSLSSESNCDSKSPFVLQTLKRLEKSQSILVIRNSTS